MINMQKEIDNHKRCRKTRKNLKIINQYKVKITKREVTKKKYTKDHSIREIDQIKLPNKIILYYMIIANVHCNKLLFQ